MWYRTIFVEFTSSSILVSAKSLCRCRCCHWCIQLYLKRCFKNKYIPFCSYPSTESPFHHENKTTTNISIAEKLERTSTPISISFFFSISSFSLARLIGVCHHYYCYYFSLLGFLLHINATSYHITHRFHRCVNWFLFAFSVNCRLLHY